MVSEKATSSESVQKYSPDIVRRDKKFGIIMGTIGIAMLYGGYVNDILGAKIIARATGFGFLLAGGYSFFLHKNKKTTT